MLLPALGAARAGMTAATRLLDSSAGTVARSTAAAASPAPAAPAAATGSTPAPAAPSDDLVGAVTGLLLSRDLMAANVATARRADEAYGSVLHLLERPQR